MEIKGYFRKKELDEIIQHVNECNGDKEIEFDETIGYIEEDGSSTYQCLYSSRGFDEEE